MFRCAVYFPVASKAGDAVALPRLLIFYKNKETFVLTAPIVDFVDDSLRIVT